MSDGLKSETTRPLRCPGLEDDPHLPLLTRGKNLNELGSWRNGLDSITIRADFDLRGVCNTRTDVHKGCHHLMHPVAVRPEDEEGFVESKATAGAPKHSVDGVPVRFVVISGS
jgi:hypothetical protein